MATKEAKKLAAAASSDPSVVSDPVKVKKPKAPKVVDAPESQSEPGLVKETKPRTKKTAAAPEPVVVQDAAVVVDVKQEPAGDAKPDEDVHVVSVDDVAVMDTTVKIADLIRQFNDWLAEASMLKSQLKSIEKSALKDKKQSLKISKKKRKSQRGEGESKSPSGFAAPSKISDELAVFLGKPLGTEMARTEVTNAINAYIVSNNLRDTENKRRILPDKKLKALLRFPDSGEVLTYFNLQRYMKTHFQSKKSQSA